MKFPIILFFISSLVFFTCKKKEVDPTVSLPKPIKTIPVSNEIKDWAFFKIGSYWIVRNDSTNQIDSLYVSAIQYSTYTLTSIQPDTIIYADQIIMTFKSSSFHSTYTISSYPNDNVMSHIVTNSSVLKFKILELDTINPSLEIVENKILSNLTIGGNNYSDVRYIECYFVYSLPSNPTLYYGENNYWKKHIGLLKTISKAAAMQYGHFAPLSVIRYNVNQ
jgi:hypothetical protein